MAGLLGRKIASGDEIRVKRSDVKSLSYAINRGETYYRSELKRIDSRQKGNDRADKNSLPADMIYDISIVYDLWFGKDGE